MHIAPDQYHHKPHSREFLDERRDLRRQEIRKRDNWIMTPLAALAVAGSFLGMHYVFSSEEGTSSKQEEIRREFVATPPSDRGAFLIRLCNDPNIDRANFPEGMPACPTPQAPFSVKES